jgi:DNA polymerase III subunit alpha
VVNLSTGTLHPTGCSCCTPKKKVKKIKKETPIQGTIQKATEEDLKKVLASVKGNVVTRKVPIMEQKYPGIIQAKSVEVPRITPRKFIPMHCHSDYSVKDCVMGIDEYAEACLEMGFQGATLTEHGNMSSALKFYNMMKKKGIKPIIGNEVYTDDDVALRIVAAEQKKEDNKGLGEESYLGDDDYGHLLLLAPTAEAYKELLHINAKGFRDGFYKRPRVTHQHILENSKHIIATSGCLASKFNSHLRNGEDKACMQLLDDYKNAFGDRFYVELHFNELNIQKYTTEKILSMAKELDIPWVVAMDAHYAKADQARFHDYLKMIHYGGTRKNPSKFLYNTRELYVKNQTDIIHSALKWGYDISIRDIEEGLDRTMEIYDRTDFEMEMGVLKFPKFNTDPGFDPNKALKKKCIAGFHRRKKQGLIEPSKERLYIERFEREFPVIVQKGFADYFLVVSDLTDYCRRTNFHRGGGRGSAAGSVVSWFLSITEVDPLRFGLLFERFLHEDRADPPDIDLDFDSERRHEIYEQLLLKYGEEKVSPIMSFGTFGGKGVMKDLGRVFEYPFAILDKMSKLWDEGSNVTTNLENIMANNPPSDVAEFIEKEDEFWAACAFLEGKVRHYSQHAAGIVVTPGPQEDYVPVNRVSGHVVTGFQEGGDIREISDIGLLKIDALGLNNVTIVHKALESVKARKGIKIDIWAIDLDDDKLLERFRMGHTTGIFQFESSGITKFIVELQPEKFEDLILVNAAYRPGTLKAGGVDMILKMRHADHVDYPHELVEEVLGETYGVLVYQEQQMELMNKVGGFTMVEADKSRKTIKLINKASVASPEQLQKFYDMLEKFKTGAIAKTGITEEQVMELVNAMAAAAEYSFNKSHSASYAISAQQNMYLKHYHPADYAAAYLTRTRNEEKKAKKGTTGENKVLKYINMAKHEMGLEVIRPDINKSGFGWRVVDDKTIAASLNFIKGVGDSAAPIIQEFQPYTSIGDFFAKPLTWARVNKKVMEALIKTGAFDSLYPHRQTLLAAYTKWNANKKQGTYEEKKAFFEKRLTEVENDIGMVDFDDDQKLEIELELFGFYFSGSPMDKYEKVIRKLNLKSIEALTKGKRWKKGSTYGVLTKVHEHKTKRGNTMCFLGLSDGLDTTVSVTLWPELYQKYKSVLKVNNAVAIKVRPEKDNRGDWCFMIDESDDKKKIMLLDDLKKKYNR